MLKEDQYRYAKRAKISHFCPFKGKNSPTCPSGAWKWALWQWRGSPASSSPPPSCSWTKHTVGVGLKRTNSFSLFRKKLSLNSFFQKYTKIAKFVRNLAKIKKCLIAKRQTCNSMWNKGNIFVNIFWWHVCFCQKNCENICFPESFLKNLCMTGAIYEASWKHLLIKKKKMFSQNLCENIKSRLIFTRYFFWRSKHLNQYFLCRHWLFSRSFKSFSVSYTSINFLFASLKLLTETLLRFPFSVIGQYSIFYCQPLIDCREN